MSVKSYKFLFHLHLGKLSLSTSFQCNISATWKRSSQVINGSAIFNQTLTLPVNMYFDQNTNSFQDKKTQLSFTLHTPKGDKSAGVVIIDLAIMLNNKVQQFEDKLTLDKCPDKSAKIQVKVTCESKGQNNPSQISAVGPVDMSTISIPSLPAISQPQQFTAQKPSESLSQSIEEKLLLLQKQNKKLQSEIATLKSSSQNNDSKKQIDKLNSQLTSLKSQLSKSKTNQQSLQKQILSLKKQQQQQRQQIEQSKTRLEQIFIEFEKYI